MIETITIITLALLLMSFLHPGKTEPLHNPLTISRVGQFNAVLAPMINLAQPFLECISSHLSEQNRKSTNTQPYYFEVNDKEVRAHGSDTYLLAITLRDGELHFHATIPMNQESKLDTIRAFSAKHLPCLPASQTIPATDDSPVMNAIRSAAKQYKNEIVPL